MLAQVPRTSDLTAWLAMQAASPPTLATVQAHTKQVDIPFFKFEDKQ